MRWWKFSTILTLAAVLGAWGCGSGSSSNVTITISPTSASVITNRTQLFSGLVSGSTNTAITWTIACATGVAANTCGSIDATGLYTAPATIPTIPPTGSATTPTIAPTVTVTGTSQADTSKFSQATLTIVTGISITITQSTATVGTGETFTFTATVNNPGCNLTSNPTCQNITWSVPTSTTNPNPDGSIGSTTGVYTAPTSVPAPSTIIITATSVADTSVTATATVSIVTASTPTVTSVSPNATALGGIFQDIYITGTNFISTDNVFVNGVQLSPTLITGVSTRVIRARIPDFILAVPPPQGVLSIGVAEQSGAVQTCPGTDQSPCQVTVSAVRPGVVGPTPTTVSQNTAGVLSFNVDGGFFGTGSSPSAPAVNATFNGQLRGVQLPPSQSIGSTRQLTVTIGGGSNASDFSVPGLYPVAIKSNSDPTKFAVANLAVQPSNPLPTPLPSTPIAVGSIPGTSAPSDVAVNPATGVAVVANFGSNDVSLIQLPANPQTDPPTLIANICTASVGATSSGCAPSGPTSVAVDYVRNIALVVNQTAKTIAVVDLKSKSISAVLPPLTDSPEAVGINPITGRALVAIQQRNYGVLVDVTGTPAYAGIVSISTGSNTKVAVEPHLNWAIATPGTLGSLGIVDLSQQSVNTITAISRTNNGSTDLVTVTVQSIGNAPPLAVQAGDAVFIQNINFPAGTDPTITAQAASLNGFFTVASVGPGPSQFSYTQTGTPLPDVATQSAPQTVSSGTVNYAQPVATVAVPISVQGIGINPETQQAVLVDPTTGGNVSFFSLIDQSISSLSLRTNNSPDVGTVAAAYNPLTNTVVAVNFTSNQVSVIDPIAPRRLNDNSLFSSCPNPKCGPVAVAIDPATNVAVIANQTDGSVSVFNLGPIQPVAITSFYLTDPVTGKFATTFIANSSIGASPNPTPQTLTVIGKGLTCSGTILKVRLDAQTIPTSCPGSDGRVFTATVPSSFLTTARRFALDVADSTGSQVTNAEDFAVEQSVDVSSPACPNPEPSGVSIDPEQNIAAVTLFSCNSVALINIAQGSGTTVTVGQHPIGVAVLPTLHVAVVANNSGSGSGTASIVDELQQSVTQTVGTGSGPVGAAADDATGEVAIANSLTNTVTIVNAVTGGASTISTGQAPVAVAFNYVNHQVAVATSGGNTIDISAGTGGTVSQSFSVSAPTSVVYDPVTTDCGSNVNGATTNTAGCFIADSSTGNSVSVIDPITSIQTTFRIGINPTSIAYNYRTSTLASTNTLSHTISVADFLGQKIRAVLPLPSTAANNTNLALQLSFGGQFQYAMDVHPFTNVAVIADTVNGNVLFVPLPH